MSAPKTNIDKQRKWHRFPLMGIGGVLLWAGVLLAAWIVWLVYEGNQPATAGLERQNGVYQAAEN
jgi:hypothetical protein